MEWWEKEEAYDSTFRAGKQCKDLWKHIPAKIKDAVEDVAVDCDGYWIYLNNGWTAYDSERTIHEYNIADLRDAIKTIRKGENK